jgi:hypothetical protein
MQDIKKGGMPIISQLISYIPLHIIDQAVEEHESDKYYKYLKTKEHLAFILYGVIGKLESLNALVKSLAFLGKALIYFGITQLPARSTLADANRNRKSDVFGKIYLLLADYYKTQLSGSYLNGMIDKKIDIKNVKIFDSLEPEKYNIHYGLSEDKTAITIVYDEQINKAEAANLIFPMVGSDLWDLKFGYRGFPRGFDYTIYVEAGYRRVPSNIQRATSLLIEDIKCNGLDYIGRYITDYTTDQFKIKFDDRVFEGTGNMIVDKILSKYAKSIRKIGVL